MNLIGLLAPPNLLATAQGLFAGATGLAGIVSLIIGGMLLDQLGVPGLYLILSGLYLAAFVFCAVGILLLPVIEEPPAEQPA